MCEIVNINLFDLFTSSSKTRTEEIIYELNDFNLTNTTYPVVSKSPIKLNFQAFEIGKIKLTGSFDITLEIPCDRCLEPVNELIKCEFDTILLSEVALENEEDADVVSYLVGNDFDVYDFVNLSVLMNMPSKVLCQDDCKGLCPVCGNNLNISDCGCDSFVPDPRMAMIKDIFNGNKEV